MFQRDYIQRQIQQLTEALAQVLFHRRNQDYSEALAEIRESGLRHLGLDLDDLQGVTYSDLVEALRPGDDLDAEAAAFVAELLRQQADLMLLENADEAAAAQRYLHALALTLDVFFDAPGFQSPDTLARINTLLRATNAATLPRPLQFRLLHFFETTGQFDKAEDVLFVLAEQPDPACYAAGLALYDRLRLVSMPRLSRGRLPFQEIAEGRRAFEQLFPDTLRTPPAS